MKTFTDTAGRTWTVHINVSTIRQVRGLVEVDLCALVDDGLQALGKLISDPVRLADVLFALVKEEAETRGVSDETFGRSLAGDTLTLAADALVEELIDFFPDARTRAGLRKVVGTGRQVRDRLLTHAEKLLETLDPQSAADNWIASLHSSPESSVSTPDPLPSAN